MPVPEAVAGYAAGIVCRVGGEEEKGGAPVKSRPRWSPLRCLAFGQLKNKPLDSFNMVSPAEDGSCSHSPPDTEPWGGICGKGDLSRVACGEIAISLRETAEDFPLLFRLLPFAGKEKRRVVPGEDRHGLGPSTP